MTRLVTLIALVTALGCASDAPPTAPSPVPGANSGTWVGTTSDSLNGAGTLRLELTELTVDASRSLWGGTWRLDVPAPASASSGTFTGTRDGGVVQLILQPTPPVSCPPGPTFVIPGTVAATNLTLSGGSLTGAYTYAACSGSVPGTLSVRRQ